MKRFLCITFVVFVLIASQTSGYCVQYEFEPISEPDGLWPSINNLGEIVYYIGTPEPGNDIIYSTVRGDLVTGVCCQGTPDINDEGEVVYNPRNNQIYSTVRGFIDSGNTPTINNSGEIVYIDSAYPRDLVSNLRGVIASGPRIAYPDINDSGEVVYSDLDSLSNTYQIFSTERGQVTSDPIGAYSPCIGNNGEIIYTTFNGGGFYQLISTVHGQITDENSFLPYLTWMTPEFWEGEVDFGLYIRGLAYPDTNDQGQIVFSMHLCEGPYWDEDEFGEYYYCLARSQIWLATLISEPSEDAILEFFDESVEDGTLIGDGPGNSANGRLNALRNMLEMAGFLIDSGNIEDACGQLKAVLSKCDGDSPPPDFVTGPAVTELHDMILELMDFLGCE